MELVNRSPLSEKQLFACAAQMLWRYGKDVASQIDKHVADMRVAGDAACHATWINIGLSVIEMIIVRNDEPKH